MRCCYGTTRSLAISSRAMSICAAVSAVVEQRWSVVRNSPADAYLLVCTGRSVEPWLSSLMR